MKKSGDLFEYDAVFYEAFAEEEAELKKFLPDGRKYFFTWKTIQESKHDFPLGPIVSLRTQSKIPEEWADSIKAIVTRSTGYDHINEYFTSIGRKLNAAYLPDYAARAVAEQALTLWAALSRKLNEQRELFQQFLRDGLTGREIRGRTISVIGVGRIGSQVVDIAHGLGMRVLGVDIAPNLEIEKKYALKYVTLDEALREAEIVVCALPLTDITRGMLNYEKLSALPSGAIFINIARGEISPSEDLLRLLDEKHLNGVGLDVFDHEKALAAVLRDGEIIENIQEPARSSVEAVLKLMKHPKAILTPHNAFNTEESVGRKSEQTAENLQEFFSTGKFLTPIV